ARSTKVKQAFQAVVTVDHTTIEIVQVTRCKTAAVQLYHRTDFRRNDRQYIEYHPRRVVAGTAEGFDDFKTLDRSCQTLSCCSLKFLSEHFELFVELYILQKVPDCLSTHFCSESVTVLVVVFTVLTLCQQLLRFESGGTRLDHHVGGEINDLFKGTR